MQKKNNKRILHVKDHPFMSNHGEMKNKRETTKYQKVNASTMQPEG